MPTNKGGSDKKKGSSRNTRASTQNKGMLKALEGVDVHSSAGASHGTDGTPPVEAVPAETEENPQTQNKDPPPVHTATGTDTSANAPPTGSAETDDTLAAGGVESNAALAKTATDAPATIPAADPRGSGQEDSSSQTTRAQTLIKEYEARMERAKALVKDAAAGLRMVEDNKAGENLPLGDLLSGSLAAFGSPLVEAAPFRDRTLESVPLLLEEGEMPFNLKDE